MRRVLQLRKFIHNDNRNILKSTFHTTKYTADESNIDEYQNMSENAGTKQLGNLTNPENEQFDFDEFDGNVPVENQEKKIKIPPVKVTNHSSFASLLRHSAFMNLGDPEGKVTVGTIFNVVGNDLYIDFGWKFYCVCQKPFKNNSGYVRGAKVRLKIKDLELSTRFLGGQKDVTLLEADCVLLGLLWSPMKYVTTTDQGLVSIPVNSK